MSDQLEVRKNDLTNVIEERLRKENGPYVRREWVSLG